MWIFRPNIYPVTMETVKEHDKMRYAYIKTVILQKYKHLNSQMASIFQKCSAQDQTGLNWVIIGRDPANDNPVWSCSLHFWNIDAIC